MNLDILIKLVKLANHNNTEGEANAAARKVCKMLGEDNYKWIESLHKNGKAKVNQSQEWHPYEDPLSDIFNYVRRESQRQKEREERERQQEKKADERTRYTGYYGFTGQKETYNTYDEARYREEERKNTERAKKEYEDFARKAKEEQKRKEQNEWRRTWSEPINYGFKNSKGFKKVYSERLRRCATCGYDRMTTDETPAYVCAKCKRENV